MEAGEGRTADKQENQIDERATKSRRVYVPLSTLVKI